MAEGKKQESVWLRATRLELSHTKRNLSRQLLGEVVLKEPSNEVVVELDPEASSSAISPRTTFRLVQGDRDFEAEVGPGSDEVTLHLRAASELTTGKWLVWLVSDPRFILEHLIAKLENTEDCRLGSALDERNLSPATRTEPFDELNEAQSEAANLMLSDGLHAVWGPPGTGKTRVIGEAARRAVQFGERVLIVSSTNVAVDHALEKTLPPRPSSTRGASTHVRIGMPSDAASPLVRACELGELVRVQTQDRRVRLKVVQEQLAELGREHEAASKAKIEFDTTYGGASVAQISSAVSKVAASREAVKARQKLRDAETRHRSAAKRLERIESEHSQLEEQLSLAERSLAATPALEAAKQDLFAISRRVSDAQKEKELAANRHYDLAKELSSLGALRRLFRAEPVPSLQAALAESERYQAQLFTEAQAAADEQGRLGSEVLKLTEVVARGDAARVGEFKERLEAVSAQVSGRKLHEAAARRELDEASRIYARSSAVAEPSSAELKLADLAEGIDVVALADDVRAFESVLARCASAREALQKEAEELDATIKSVESRVLSEAKVVATTVAQLAVRKDLVKQAFDVVIVDEASAVLLPFAYLSLTLAKRSATFVGDPYQNGPITSVKHRTGESSEVTSLRELLKSDVFRCLGVLAPKRAGPGLAILNVQYRFGPAMTDLVNELVYDGLLEAFDTSPRTDPEVVFVDVNDLGAAGYRWQNTGGSSWWAAGPLLVPRIIAQLGDKGSVAHISPYRSEIEVVKAALATSDHRRVPSFTVHQMQGREVDYVVLDFVEGAKGQGWIGKATRENVSGLRVLNVALTRARKQVICILDGGALRSGGFTFGALEETRKKHRLPVLSALEDVLEKAPKIESHLTMVEFEPTFRQWIREAERSITIWSPFVGEPRLRVLREDLEQALERGVTVTLIVLEKYFRQKSRARAPLESLERRGLRLFRWEGLHSKAGIFDGEKGFMGSANVLSWRESAQELLSLLQTPKAVRGVSRPLVASLFENDVNCQRNRDQGPLRRVEQDGKDVSLSCVVCSQAS